MLGMERRSFTITPDGPFSLAEAATFGFGQRAGGDWDGVMRLAFCLDGYSGQVAAEIRQDGTGTVHGAVQAPAGVDLGPGPPPGRAGAVARSRRPGVQPRRGA